MSQADEDCDVPSDDLLEQMLEDGEEDDYNDRDDETYTEEYNDPWW